MKNKYSGLCFCCEKYVGKQRGRLAWGVKLVCIPCYKEGGHETVVQKRQEADKAYHNSIINMWWNK